MSVRVDIEFDDDELKRLVKRIKQVDNPPGQARAMSAVVALVRGDIAQYPPESEANKPGRVREVNGRSIRLGHYVRGSGWVTPGGRRLENSEALGRRWTDKVTQGGQVGEVGNNASYVRWVQDEDKQAGFHKARGWSTVQEVIERRRVAIRTILLQPIKALLGDD